MLDTNVLVYAYTPDDVAKQRIAVSLTEELLLQNRLVVSVQVLNEFYAAITRPARKVPLSHDEALLALRRLAIAAHVVPLEQQTTFDALDGVAAHGLSFWDALIWATAKLNGVGVIYTEDFQHGREIEGVRFENPFATAP